MSLRSRLVPLTGKASDAVLCRVIVIFAEC